MSRIEEAMRRAGTGAAGSESSAIARERIAMASKRHVHLEDFVAEQESAIGLSDDLSILDRAQLRSAANAKVPAAPSMRIPRFVEGKLISLTRTEPQSLEQYQRLAATVHMVQQQHGIKVLMVTSTARREGRTITSANLALALGHVYKKNVLLIDGDLRRPAIHEIFGISNASGLREGLATEAGSLSAVQVTPALAVLPAGRAKSSALAGLTSERMRAVLTEAAARFDWVILDTPPVDGLPDARLMAEFVDGVIFVIGANTTDYRRVEHALSEIGRERVIGAVLNRVDEGITQSGFAS
jgi:capsular exopolysaccharide synthesis family protein